MSMQSLLAASQSMARMQTMQSARTQMQGSANILRIESKQDGGNELKDAKADALEEKSNDLMGNIMDEVTDVNETIKPDDADKAEADSKEEETGTEKGGITDTVTISDIGAGYKGALSTMNPVMGEEITYNADGSKTANAPVPTTQSFQVTA